MENLTCLNYLQKLYTFAKSLKIPTESNVSVVCNDVRMWWRNSTQNVDVQIEKQAHISEKFKACLDFCFFFFIPSRWYFENNQPQKNSWINFYLHFSFKNAILDIIYTVTEDQKTILELCASLVAWPLNENDPGGDLILLETSLPFSCELLTN